jgi:hypothetical protein
MPAEWDIASQTSRYDRSAYSVVCEKPGKRQFGLSSTLFGAFEIARK